MLSLGELACAGIGDHKTRPAGTCLEKISIEPGLQSTAGFVEVQFVPFPFRRLRGAQTLIMRLQKYARGLRLKGTF